MKKPEAQALADGITQRLGTLGELIDGEFERRLQSRPKRYQQGMRSLLARINSRIGSADLASLKTPEIQSFVDQEAAADAKPQTIKHLVGALRAVFRLAIELGIYDRGLPTEALRLPPIQHSRKISPPFEIAIALADGLPAPLRLLGKLQMATGVRFTEVSTLRRRCVENHPGIPGWGIARLGKTEVLLSPIVMSELRGELAAPGPALLFPNTNGKPHDRYNSAARHLGRKAKPLKLPRASWDDFRGVFVELVNRQEGLSSAEKAFLLRRPSNTWTLRDSRFDEHRVYATLDRIAASIFPTNDALKADASELRAECRRLIKLATDSYGISERAIARKAGVDKRVIHRLKNRVSVKKPEPLQNLIAAAKALISQKKSVPT